MSIFFLVLFFLFSWLKNSYSFFNLPDPEIMLFFPDEFHIFILVGLRLLLSFWQLVIDKTLDLEFSLIFFLQLIHPAGDLDKAH